MSKYNTEAIYSTNNGGGYSYFFSPDGIGRVWFESLEEAKDQTGLEKVIVLAPANGISGMNYTD